MEDTRNILTSGDGERRQKNKIGVLWGHLAKRQAQGLMGPFTGQQRSLAGMAGRENGFHQMADKLHSRALKLLAVLASHFPNQKNNLVFN